MAVSVRVRWCGVTSAVTFTPAALARAIAATEAAVLTWQMCTVASSYSAISSVRDTSRLSHSEGMPVRPRRADTGDSCIWPPFISESSCAWIATKRPLTLTY